MTASEDYQVNNWKDPELMFGEKYQPFDLFRDLNSCLPSDVEVYEGSYDQIPDLTHLSFPIQNPSMIEDPEDLQALTCSFNFTTKSSDANQSQESLKEIPTVSKESCETLPLNNNLVQVQHIDKDGPLIFVTRKRYSRIMKQRTKRLAFLELMPEYKLPYNKREKKIKYKTRSKMAKDRKRNSLGKFSNAKNPQAMISFGIDSTEVFDNINWRRKQNS